MDDAPPAYDQLEVSLSEAPPSYASLFPSDDISFDNGELMSITPQKTPLYQAKETLRLCDMSYKTGETWSELVAQEEAQGFKIVPFAAPYEERSGFVRIHQSGHCDIVYKGTKNTAMCHRLVGQLGF